MAVTASDPVRDLARLDELIAQQERLFLARMPRSTELLARARRSLAGGVASTWQDTAPQAVYVSHGLGSRIVDVDGNEYVDLHGGFGVMLVGHAHPAVVRAVTARIVQGSHFAQPTPDAVVVAEALAERFGLPLWRFCNSGTEATMDAVHLMRAITGRERIVKIEGTYHGHHDSVCVSVYEEEDIGPADRPVGVRTGREIPAPMAALTLVAPFNDLAALERLFAEHRSEIAGVLVEPIMMNVGIIPPAPGYLEGLREITARHGAILAFDEVKTGFTVGPGGVTRLSGVTPDIVCLAKALGGGLPCGAIGGTAEVMGHIADRTYQQVGTFNGNPLTMAAARATLTEVLTPEAMVEGAEEVIARQAVPAYVAAYGAKGSVIFAAQPWRNYRDFLTSDERWGHCHWLFQHNCGVFLPPWGKGEQWTLSVQHTEADAQRFVANFATFARALRG